MTDEFDDIGRHQPARGVARDLITPREQFPVARLVSRAYRTASEPLQARMLACLLRPLGTLSLVAVASGAFGRFLHRDLAALNPSAMDDAVRYSGDQVLELARFVHEVSPETLQQLVRLVADNTMGVAALSASAIGLLYRRMQPLADQSPRLNPPKHEEISSPAG